MMETLKKYWYIAVGLVLVLWMFMRKKQISRRRRKYIQTPWPASRRMSYTTYSRPMRRRSRRSRR